MENQGNKSRFKVNFSKTAERVAITDKFTEEDVETFADNVPEELLVQRMFEIREDEILRNRLVQGTSLDSNMSHGGIIVPGQEFQSNQTQIIT